MKKLITFFSVLLLACTMTFAQNLAKGSVTVENLKDIIESGYDSVKIDEDGDLLIEKNGYKVFVIVNSKNNYINFFAWWGAKDDLSDARAIRLINKWNSEKIFTIAYYKNKRFCMEYYMTFIGGINATNFNDTLDWMFVMDKAYGSFLSDEDAIQ